MAERLGLEPREPKPVHRLAICCITALPPLQVRKTFILSFRFRQLLMFK